MINNQEGFTLIELLISIAILVVGLLTIALLQIKAMEGNASANKFAEATTLAENKIEELMYLPYNDLDLVEGHYEETETIHNASYTVSWDVSDDVVVTETKLLTIAVRWNDDALPRQISLQNLKGKIE